MVERTDLGIVPVCDDASSELDFVARKLIAGDVPADWPDRYVEAFLIEKGMDTHNAAKFAAPAKARAKAIRARQDAPPMTGRRFTAHLTVVALAVLIGFAAEAAMTGMASRALDAREAAYALD